MARRGGGTGKVSREKETISRNGNDLVPSCLTIHNLGKEVHSWELIDRTETAMTHLTEIYKKYGEVGKEMLDVEREVDDKCDITDDEAKMSSRRRRRRMTRRRWLWRRRRGQRWRL